MSFVRPMAAALAAALALSVVLTACGPGRSPRGSAAGYMSSDDRANFGETNVDAAMRRLFSPMRQGPSGN